MEEKIDMKRN